MRWTLDELARGAAHVFVQAFVHAFVQAFTAAVSAAVANGQGDASAHGATTATGSIPSSAVVAE